MNPVSYEMKNIGALLKVSKQHYKWRLDNQGQIVTIEVLSSKLSGRRRVYKDGFLIQDQQSFDNSFTFMFTIAQYSLNLGQFGEHFELRIDNVSFNHLLAQQKVKRAFIFEDPNQQRQQQMTQDKTYVSKIDKQQIKSQSNQFDSQLTQNDPWAEVHRARQEVLQIQTPQTGAPLRHSFNPQIQQSRSKLFGIPKFLKGFKVWKPSLKNVKSAISYKFGGFQRKNQTLNHLPYDDPFSENEPQQIQNPQTRLNDVAKKQNQAQQAQQIVENKAQPDLGFNFDFSSPNQQPIIQTEYQKQPESTKNLLVSQNELEICVQEESGGKNNTEDTEPAAVIQELDCVELQNQLDELDTPLHQLLPESEEESKVATSIQSQEFQFDFGEPLQQTAQSSFQFEF